MAQEVGIREVLQQVNARLDNQEAGLREVRQELRDLRQGLGQELRQETGNLRQQLLQETGNLRREMVANFRWTVGIQLAMWASLLVGLLLAFFTR